MVPRVKICCIASIEEAKMAIRYGASAIGLVSEMPSGPGVIQENLIAEIAKTVPPGVASFLLTSKQSAASIIEQQKKTSVNTIQICDRISHEGYNDLRSALPGIAIVQVIHVTGTESIEEAKSVAPYVNAILLDSGNQSLPVKELGGTGRVHDWTISRRIRESVNVPLYLAGGINALNVVEANNQVQPFGIDVCSGVRTNGKLDELKLEELFQQVHMIH
jgi:phosphoribosylanthranilate isomerase